MSDHERIWLQPECCAGSASDRFWCEHDAPEDCPDGAKWTEYVRSDIHESGHAELVEALRAVTFDERGGVNFAVDVATPHWRDRADAWIALRDAALKKASAP